MDTSVKVVKRTMDLAIAGAGLVLGAPLFAAIAAAIKLTSKGPVFYMQTRAGAVTDPRVALEIPVQLSELMEHDLPLAREWRAASRQWLTDLFARGYRIVRLERVRDDRSRPAAPYRTFYILEACENRTD